MMNFSGLLLPSTFLELSLAMNNDASGCENPEEITKRKDDVSKNSGHTIMSYKCSFCKRRFSNAQALGGHMNIHRKDRAKLREFSNENLLSLDITKTIDLDGEGSPDPTETKKKPNSCDELEDVVPTISKHSTVRGLPLFTEMPLVCDDEKNVEKKNLDLIHGEVDLELRLGHEP